MNGAVPVPAEPYVGPRPFEAPDRGLFFGREREAHEISSLVLANRFFMLYATSGAGKTSVVNAGVLPLLGDELEVLPTARLLARAQPGSEDAANVYTHAVLSCWADPQDLAGLAQTTLSEFLASRPRADQPFGVPKPRLLVFDQFEELFTTHPERWQERRIFLEQLAEASSSDPELRVLVVLREDFLSRLLGFADTFYGGLKDRYFLEPLRKPAAELAITGPLRGTGRSFEPAAVDDLARRLMTSRVDLGDARVVQVEGEFVEPVLLQVVCQKLWAGLPAGVSVITPAAIRDVSTSLADFYSDAVRHAAETGLVPERRIREWVQNSLLTHPGGTRGTVHVGPETTAGLPNEAVERLVGTLLRAEFRAGARWLEITHDSLLDPIEQSNTDFFRADSPLAQEADALALAVTQYCQAEAAAHQLNDPYPLPVSWTAADRALMDAWEKPATAVAGWPPTGIWDTGTAELDGSDSDLPDVLARVPSRRLVVLGDPGSGKTMLMVRLVLELLARRASGGPVPVLVSAASWDPAAQDLRSWLSAQVTISLTGLAPPGARSGTAMQALLAAGLIFPVLDGLDEIPGAVRGLAITRINDELGPGAPLIATCRTQQYQDTARPPVGTSAILRVAAVVELNPLPADGVARYLRASAGGQDVAARWDPVIAVLGTDAPAGQAMATPLMVGLARAIYNPRPSEQDGESRDPAELCDPEFADCEAVERHLFGAFIPAAYRLGGRRRWTARQAELWLGFLASYLQSATGSPGVAWWQLARATPSTALGLAAGMAIGLAIAVAGGVVLGTGWLAIAVTGLVLGLAFGLGLAGDRRPARGLRWSPKRAVPAGVVTAVVTGAAVGLAAGPVFGLAAALVAAVVLSLTVGLGAVSSGRQAPMSPQAAFGRDRHTALVAGLARGATTGAVAGVVVSVAASIPRGAMLGVLSAFAAGLATACYESAWPRWQLTRSWLAVRRRLPWRLMVFLADAHHRGVLRQEGPFYQIRYMQLQQRLASRSRQLRPEHPFLPGRRRWLAPAGAVVPAIAALAVLAVVAASAVVATGVHPRGRHSVHPRGRHVVTVTPPFLTPYTVLADPSSLSAAGVAFSRNGREIAVADLNGVAYLWKSATLSLITRLRQPGSGGIAAVAFSPSGKTLAAGDQNGSVYLWDLATGRLRTTLRCTGSGGISAVAFGPHGAALAAGGSSDRGLTCVWDPATGVRLARLSGGTSGIGSVAFSPDGKILAVGDSNSVTFLWERSAFRLLSQFHDAGQRSVGSVAFSPDGQILAVGDRNGSTYLWNLANLASPLVRAALPGPGRSGGVNAVAFSPDGKTLAAAAGDGSTYLRNVATGKLIAVLADQLSGGVSAVAFSPDGRTLATADRNGQTYLWKSPASAQAEAQAINSLLVQSVNSRSRLIYATNLVNNCTNLSYAVSVLQQIANGRRSELNQAQGLKTEALPNGSALKSDLIQALRYSLNADKDYLAWAQNEEVSCQVGSEANENAAASSDDIRATQYKTLFVGLWNPIAAQYGLRPASPYTM